MADQPVVAVMSPGQMGHAVGRVLRRHGLRVITALDVRSARTVELADVAGIENVGSLRRVVDEADIVLSLLPSAAAPVLAEQLAELLAGRDRPLAFVECNALAPQTVRAIAATVAAAGSTVVDVGIVGGPPTDARGPKFCASGPELDAVLALGRFGLDVRPIGPELGQASAMKMCYAALTKGLTALGTELLLAAAEHDLLDTLLDEFQSSQPELLHWLQQAVPGMPAKSRRWVSEMQEIAATLEALGLSGGYHQSASELYAWVGQTRLGAERPEARDTGRDLRTTLVALAESRGAP